MAIDDLGLEAFGSEASAEAGRVAAFPAQSVPARPSTRQGGNRLAWTIVLVVVGVAALGGGAYAYYVKHPISWPRGTGSVTVETVPAALEIFVNGKTVGKSPVTVSLAAGSYQVRLGASESARTVTIPVTAGASVIQHYELAAAVSAPSPIGTVRIQTEPAKLMVMLDGVERGVSPLTLDDVAPGDHSISVKGEQGLVERTVHVGAGETTSVIIASAQARPDANAVMAGWLTVTSPIPLQVREKGRLLGTSDVEKLMLSSGDHDVDLVEDTLGYRAPLHVKIAAGKTTVSKISVPNGTLSLNAQPWADVFIDGKAMGQTPIGNAKLAIGRHEVVFRHPDLGERKETVTVTLAQPARLGVDLRKQ